ncbi:MAG TPA: hypothetical protein VG778_04485, partial [Blastocatellia bacterium]|nr:hypothetical protein [Blastocatellia bacterium]
MGLALSLGASLVGAYPSSQAFQDPLSNETAPAELNCGYDPAEADAQWSDYLMRARTRNRSAGAPSRRGILQADSDAGPLVEDHGDVAVVIDDGTAVIEPNKFDLKKRSLLFTPDGSEYRLERGKLPFENDIGFKLDYFFGIGSTIVEADNGYREMALAFPFTFFGVQYHSIFIGTNGFITFGRGDTSTKPSAAEFSSSLPRIAPLWSDLEAISKGGIYFSQLPGRYVITWQGVPQAIFKGANTFQVILYEDGKIALIYKKAKSTSSLIGISPGLPDQDAQAVDFSQPPEEAISGVYELFSTRKRLDIPALTQAFYETHQDAFDFIYIWTDFEFDNGIGLAHAFNVRNDTRGIGLKVFDRGSIYGSPSRLATIITMGDTADWPSDP